MGKLKIDDDAIQDIDREAIVAARSGHSWVRTARVSKMMNRWLPVGHNRKHHGSDIDTCPGCGAPDETFQHLFRCPHEKLRATCHKGIEHIEKAGTSLQIPASIMWLLIRIVKKECDIEDATAPTLPSLRTIWDAQLKIGFSNFVIGWISRSWQRGLRRFDSKDPGGQAAQIITLIWDGLCEPIWTCHNDIKSNTPNPAELLEMASLKEKLKWYKKYKMEVLPARFRPMAKFSSEEIKWWDRDNRRAMIRILNIAVKIHQIQCKQRVKGQRVVTDFFR
jgi:hypothetical protein